MEKIPWTRLMTTDVIWAWAGTRLGPAAQRVLQQRGELGVAERDVRAAVGVCVDDVTQRGQALVDVLCLLQPRTRGLGAPHALAA